MFLHKLTLGLVAELGLNYFSINNPQYFERIRTNSWIHFMESKNYAGVFGPIRAGAAEPSIPTHLEDSSIFMHLRDPRDVLTSLFYSLTYSHPKKEKWFNPSDQTRKQWEQEGIDHFVLDKKETYIQRYTMLCEQLLNHPNVVFLKYETMVTDYSTWLKGFLSAFEHIPIPDKRILGLFSKSRNQLDLFQQFYKKHKNDFSVSEENVYKHRRQITPGDYLRKLKPTTIQTLNEDFEEILIQLGYDVKV